MWQGGEVADFVFEAQVKFEGNNSGVQYRSELVDEKAFVVKGYQCDLHPKADYFGMLYAEKWRGIVATRGQKVVVTGEDKKKDIAVSKLPADNRKLVDTEWNTVKIVAVGNRIIHQINDVTTVDLTDDYPGAPRKGILALQLHQGPAMKVQFKDLTLKHLDKKTGPEVLKKVLAVKKEQNVSQPHKIIVDSEHISAKEALSASEIVVPTGFRVELLYNVPLKEQGSWVALTKDPQGRLVASDQGKNGIYRITVKDTEANTTNVKVEKLPIPLSGGMGILYAFNKMYFSKNGDGLYEVTDGDGDGELEKVTKLPSSNGGGEHGIHAVILTEDGKNIYFDGGNHSSLPPLANSRVTHYSEDLLLPRQWDARGHARGRLAPGGWITIFDPIKKTHELFCNGFRNQYDITLNDDGELFAYDADMEWDFGSPWYRPTRICHAVSGAEFGWRSGTGKWPTYYEDSLPPVVDIGPGSPTGFVSGKGLKYPSRYQKALYALDWTFGTIYLVGLEPHGASYTGKTVPFCTGVPLPVTDAVVGDDGALYFTVGGRGTQSALYRIVYEGEEVTELAKDEVNEEAQKARALRRSLEKYHGKKNPEAIPYALKYIGDKDRFIRYAARIAIESQPVEQWADKVLSLEEPQAIITGAVALARMGKAEHKNALINKLNSLKLNELGEFQTLGALRAYHLTFIKFGKPSEKQLAEILKVLNPLFPHKSKNINRETLDLMVYLEAPGTVEKGMNLIVNRSAPEIPYWAELLERNERYGAPIQAMLKNHPPSQEIWYAFALRNLRKGWTIEQRRAYFTFLNEASKKSGGNSYPGFLTNIRNEALALCSNKEREALEDITGEDFNPVPDFEIKPIVGPGKKWTIDQVNTVVNPRSLKKANFVNGRSLYFASTCGKCHRYSGLGGDVGPDLTSLPNKFDQNYLVTAIINPSKDISDQYQASNVILASGKTVSGLVVEDGDFYVIYPSDTSKKETKVAKSDVLDLEPSKVSQMPMGLLDTMNEQEVIDLMAYLLSGGNPNNKKIYGTKPKPKAKPKPNQRNKTR